AAVARRGTRPARRRGGRWARARETAARRCAGAAPAAWSGSRSRRTLHARAAQRQPEQPEERRRQEEARVPLVVARDAARLVDLALLERVEHLVQPALERFLVG